MGDKSGIQWTDATWNPVTGCTKVSAGCKHCYAETIANRKLPGGGFTDRPFTEVRCHPERLDQPLRWKKPRRIFVNSMSDLFHEDVPDEFIGRVWQVMGAAPQHVFQVLTKRPERMLRWAQAWYAGEIQEPHDARPIKGYPGYTVTTHGTVHGKRADTKNWLSTDVSEQGHQRVTMHHNGSPRTGERELVHRLVLTAFVRPPRPREQACHRNGDTSDNRLSNLYWGTQETNWQDRIRHGNAQSYAKLTESDVTEIRRRAERGESAYRIAKDYPVSDTQIRNIVDGRQWVTPKAGPPVLAPARTVLDGVWLGTSCEDQATADERIPLLLQTPAAIRFVSAEPLIGPINFARIALTVRRGYCDSLRTSGEKPTHWECSGNSLGWIIVGGESGPGARPFDIQWARDIIEQCKASSVACFYKQGGTSNACQHDRKGGHFECFPADLKVREFPDATQRP